jgi:valyl-tRNA synthetase
LLKLLHPVLPHVTEEIWAALPERTSRLIVAPWPTAGDESEAGALIELQEAAEIFRRSGIAPKGLDDERQRIFDAVVKPARVRVNGDVDAERARLRGEIERAERMLANERFVAKAPADVVRGEREKLERYRRELDAISD